MRFLNYQSVTAMKFISFIVIGLLWVQPSIAQETSQGKVTEITITDGVDRYTAADLEAEVDTLLRAIQTWNTTGEDTFPEEPGSERLKQLVTRQNLDVYYHAIQTVAVEAFDGHTVPNVVLKANTENGPQPMALALTFALDGTFLRVSADEREFSAQRILAAAIPVNPDELSQVQTFLKNYRRVFRKQQADTLAELVANDAKLITGKQKDQRNAFDFYSYTKEEYVKFASDKIFAEGNEISIRFDSVKVNRDPLNEQQVGIYAYQTYESTTYSDRGYLFLLVDLSGKRPQLQFRVWRAEPIRPGDYGMSEPELEAIVREYQEPPVDFYSGEIAVATLPYSALTIKPIRGVDPVAFPGISRPSFLQRHRYWLIAGASAIAGGVAYGILSNGSDTPGIPGPPGRPAFN
jgi:hypothetical protein